MEPREVIERLVTEVAPNATVAGFEERGAHCRVTIAGTTGVLADCDLPRDAVEAAEHAGTDRARVAAVLKRCADDVVAPLPDGRT
jgi:phage terminase large subunit-like protein